jgi:hypothetical protein
MQFERQSFNDPRRSLYAVADRVPWLTTAAQWTPLRPAGNRLAFFLESAGTQALVGQQRTGLVGVQSRN